MLNDQRNDQSPTVRTRLQQGGDLNRLDEPGIQELWRNEQDRRIAGFKDMSDFFQPVISRRDVPVGPGIDSQMVKVPEMFDKFCACRFIFVSVRVGSSLWA
jgi:hypothetical protein